MKRRCGQNGRIKHEQNDSVKRQYFLRKYIKDTRFANALVFTSQKGIKKKSIIQGRIRNWEYKMA